MPTTTPDKPIDAATATTWTMAILQDVAQGHTKMDRGHAKKVHDAIEAGKLKIVAG